MARASQSKNRKRSSKVPRPRARKRVTPSEDELLKYYKDMLLIRRFEERAGQMYGMGLIGAFAICISVRKLLS